MHDMAVYLHLHHHTNTFHPSSLGMSNFILLNQTPSESRLRLPDILVGS